MPFLFASAIDASCPLLPDGTRADAMDRGGHYARWEDDFELAASLGLNALRYGPSYYRTHVGPDRFDWEICDAPLERLWALGIETVASLCEFGVPAWLEGVHDPAFPVLFAEYARAFTRRYPWIRYFEPIHAMLAFARAAANDGIPDAERVPAERQGRFALAVRNLCMAHELAVEAILSERPEAIIVQGERLEHTHPIGAGGAALAEQANAMRHLTLDLTLGHEPAAGLAGWLAAHGVSANDLTFFRERRAPAQRLLGVGFDAWSERRIAASGRLTVARRGYGFRTLARAYHQRYRLPLLHHEMRAPARGAGPALRARWEDVIALRAAGVPVVGFSWAPLTEGVPWRADAQPVAGLASARRTPLPAGECYREVITRWRPVLARHEDDGEASFAATA